MGWVDDRRESELAWQLADVIRSVLSDSDRAHLYGVIGAGESYAAIDAALKTIVSERFPIAPELIVELLAWVDAYAHSDDAARLRQLLRSVTTVS